jgi:MFS family permease
MPLYAVLARENFPMRMMGTIIGGTAMAGSLGMATGPLAGGLIYDRFASYGWLYIGAWGIGIGAFVIALTFRPFAAGISNGSGSSGEFSIQVRGNSRQHAAPVAATRLPVERG